MMHQALVALDVDKPALRLAVAMAVMVIVGEEAPRGREELGLLEGLKI
jgi:hypothetical protein